MANETNSDGRGAADWLEPPAEQQGLQRYLETLRERWWMVVLAVIIATAAAIAYVVTAEKQYEAEADLLVTPVSSSDTLLGQLGLIRESTDPTRDVETASRLTTTVDVAERVREELGLSESARDLLDDVSAEPVAQSNIVAVSARAGTPERAQELANAFAEGVVEDRTEQLHDQIEEVLPGLRDGGGPASAEETVDEQIARLEALSAGPDPTIRVETLADLPTDPVSPRPVLSIAGGLLAGLVLGVAMAFGSQVLDPRLRREDQLRRLYRLPILARVPTEKRRVRGGPIGPRQVTPAVAEAYRTLRGTLSMVGGRWRKSSRALLVTGASPGEGKTTTAINLAASLALAGNHVILIEADLRRPAIGPAVGIRPQRGIVSVLLGNSRLEDTLVTSEAHGPNFGFLLADHEGGWIPELFSLPTAEKLVEDARRLADYVVIDSPPLTEVIDALPLAKAVDDVLVVVRVGRTRLDRVTRLGELLAESGIRPAGFAVVGTSRPGRGDYSYYAEGRGSNGRPAEAPLFRSATAPPR